MSLNGPSNSQNEKNNNKSKKSNSIKFGLISQDKSHINVYDLINSYFKNSKPIKYIIKDEFHYEFTPISFPQLTITINNLRKIENILGKYNLFHFFLIFIDIQNSNCIDFLEKAIDVIIDAGENTYNKKCFIFGFYKDNEKPKVPEEKITIIIEAKGIDYYYCQLKNDEIDNFSKTMERVINNCNTIMIEKFLDQKHSELVLDNSNSKCYIF